MEFDEINLPAVTGSLNALASKHSLHVVKVSRTQAYVIKPEFPDNFASLHATRRRGGRGRVGGRGRGRGDARSHDKRKGAWR